MIKDSIINLNSGWELVDKQRKTFEYTSDNITTINLQKFINGNWVTVFKQTLSYDINDNLLSIEGKKL